MFAEVQLTLSCSACRGEIDIVLRCLPRWSRHCVPKLTSCAVTVDAENIRTLKFPQLFGPVTCAVIICTGKRLFSTQLHAAHETFVCCRPTCVFHLNERYTWTRKESVIRISHKLTQRRLQRIRKRMNDFWPFQWFSLRKFQTFGHWRPATNRD